MEVYKMGFRPTSPTRPITPDCPRSKHPLRFGMWQKLQHFFGRDGSLHSVDSDGDPSWSKSDHHRFSQKCEASSTRPVGIGLPRQATFKRQNSEKRDRLCPIEPCTSERRAYSTSRPPSTSLTKFRSNSVPTTALPGRRSAPPMSNLSSNTDSGRHSFDVSRPSEQTPTDSHETTDTDQERPPRPPSVTSSNGSFDDGMDYFNDRTQLNRELDTKWILNLSMHFRDKSDREKFFVTYAETPTNWRRVTVSCDYRSAEPGSLEMDLRELQQQREKSMQIYESIRESLLDIKFYDTVTNLKLETTDGRLHVHVTEDMNEIIPYPPISSLRHILQDVEHEPKVIRESELSFEAHLSGFVYKVLYKDKPYIKKEIPGPDTVDEFLYEVNALYALQDSKHVIDLEAIITDESGQIIKGLLIDYAERGAVVDLLYDYKGDIGWEHRERWARNAIQGLSEIHEEGYVQGDFTLSNIVVDRENNARIIDINRRGCPVGWEPPEIAKKIASNQRISMYIGQKTDLYQLGMTLWALAMDDDEPERYDPPLSTQEFPAEVPPWYQEIVRICLSTRPRDRASATDLMKFFPPEVNPAPPSWRHPPMVRIRNEKQYIDPAAAVERDDIERFSRGRSHSEGARFSPESSREDPTYTWPQSSVYDRSFDSTNSEIERPRGRRRVSEHDQVLQAQRETDRAHHSQTELNNVHDEPPIISVISDDTDSYFLDMNHEPDLMEDVIIDSTEGIRARGLMASPIEHDISGFGQSAFGQFSDRPLFHGRSDTSEDTPRNSRLQLLGPDMYGSHRPSEGLQHDSMHDELAGLGNQHDMGTMFNEHEYGVENESHRVLHDIPSLRRCADSGFHEPDEIEIDCGNSSDVDERMVVQGYADDNHIEPHQDEQLFATRSSSVSDRLSTQTNTPASEISITDQKNARHDISSIAHPHSSDSDTITEIMSSSDTLTPLPANLEATELQSSATDITGPDRTVNGTESSKRTENPIDSNEVATSMIEPSPNGQHSHNNTPVGVQQHANTGSDSNMT